MLFLPVCVCLCGQNNFVDKFCWIILRGEMWPAIIGLDFGGDRIMLQIHENFRGILLLRDRGSCTNFAGSYTMVYVCGLWVLLIVNAIRLNVIESK